MKPKTLTLLEVTVPLSAAQILALHDAPVTLIAAVPAGQMPLVHSLIVKSDAIGTPYDMSDAVALQTRYATASDETFHEIAGATNVLAENGAVAFSGGNVADQGDYFASTFDGCSLQIRAANGNPKGGTLQAWITAVYSLVTTR